MDGSDKVIKFCINYACIFTAIVGDRSSVNRKHIANSIGRTWCTLVHIKAKLYTNR